MRRNTVCLLKCFVLLRWLSSRFQVILQPLPDFNNSGCVACFLLYPLYQPSTENQMSLRNLADTFLSHPGLFYKGDGGKAVHTIGWKGIRQVVVLQFWLSTSFVLLSAWLCAHMDALQRLLGAFDLDLWGFVLYIPVWKRTNIMGSVAFQN